MERFLYTTQVPYKVEMREKQLRLITEFLNHEIKRLFYSELEEDEEEIIVYGEGLNRDPGAREPFGKPSYNASYGDLILGGKQRGLRPVIAGFWDLDIGRMVTRGFTLNEGRGWRRVTDVPIEAVLDKFETTPETTPIKTALAAKGVPYFNHPKLVELAGDKFETYGRFPEFVIPTIAAGASKDGLDEAINELGLDLVVAKPRYGYGGKGIFLIKNGKCENGVINEIQQGDYVLSPFVESDLSVSSDPTIQGWSRKLNFYVGRHDLRIIVANGEARQAYVRQPQTGGFISNEKVDGECVGSLDYIPIEIIPEALIGVCLEIDRGLGVFGPRVYSIDSMFDIEQGRWGVVELNAKPGIVYDPENPEDVERTRELQAIILDVLVSVREAA